MAAVDQPIRGRPWLRLASRGPIAAGYVLAVLAFFEGTARLVLRSETYFQRISGNDDATWRHRWLKRRGSQPHLSYSFDVFDPGRGWALKPGIRDARPWAEATLNTNSRGLRGSAEYDYRKPPGRIRILAFGDSFTFGEEVSDHETWPRRLEELIPGAQVLNFGVHGYGHDQMLVYLQQEGVKYQADVVLLGFLFDDMERNLLSFRDYAKPRFAIEGDRLALKDSPVPSPQQVLSREPYRSKLADLFTMLIARRRERTGEAGERMQHLTLRILDEFHRTVQSMGARTGFAYLPVYGEIDKPDMAMTRREMFFFQHCRRQGIQSMYLRRFFRDRLRRGVEFKTYGHWGPLEHQTTAEGIAAYLIEKGLIPQISGIRKSDEVRSPGSPVSFAWSRRVEPSVRRPRTLFIQTSPPPST